MKRLALLLTVCILVCGLTPAAFAEDKVVVGQQLVFQEDSGPVIMEDRLMLPLRAVSEALDATVYWFGEDKRIQIVRYDALLSLQIGNSIMAKYQIRNGKAGAKEELKMDVTPTILNNRTYVPLRVISEAFSSQIQWDNENRTATIIPIIPEENTLLVSEIPAQVEGTLFASKGVICKDEATGYFYLRSLQRNRNGSFDTVSFCTPTKVMTPYDSAYAEYTAAYWQEQFGTADPSGQVILFTGVNVGIEGVNYLLLNKTTTGIRHLGDYDTYMKDLAVTYEPFGTEVLPTPTPEPTVEPEEDLSDWN